MLALFMSGRLRFDLVAALALVAAVALGVVPSAKAFSGFSNPVIIIIGSVLVVSRAIAASNVLDVWIGALLARVKSPSLQIGILTAAVGYLSAFIKNVGTLGIVMPVAIQAARRANQPRSAYLMPLAFGSLVGGTITRIGTSPNLLISSVRQELGQPAVQPVRLRAGGPAADDDRGRLPRVRLAPDPASAKARSRPTRRSRSSRIPPSCACPRRPPRPISRSRPSRSSSEGEASVAAIVREGSRRYIPAEDWRIYPGDVLVVLGDPTVIDKVVAKTGYEIVGSKELAAARAEDRRDGGARGHRHRRLDAGRARRRRR